MDSAKLLEAQTHIWNHIFSFINSMSLKCMVDLGIPDIIHNYGKPMPLSKLISSLPIHPSKAHSIYRLMRILTHSGFFSQQNNVTENKVETEYVLTDASILLLKNHPLSVAPFLQFELDPILTKPYYELSNWFKNEDQSAFETTHGKFLRDYAGCDLKFNHLFNEAMESDSHLVAKVMIEKCKGLFLGFETLVDVGGGTGTLAKEIAKCFPKLECIVLDLPHVVNGLQGSDNLKYVAGDMFQAIPLADVILMKWIMHNWNDEECIEILKKCKDAITSKGKKGKVIVIDIVMENNEKEEEDDESLETKLFFDMLMMTVLTGRQRNKKEWGKLISSAGFSDFKINLILGLRSLIEIYL